jgi:transcriptional regulator with XRE-family HTH domain
MNREELNVEGNLRREIAERDEMILRLAERIFLAHEIIGKMAERKEPASDNRSMGRKLKLTCNNCGKEFLRYLSHINQSRKAGRKGTFCSHECFSASLMRKMPEEEIWSLHQKGMTDGEIAEAVGGSRSTVQYWRKRNQLDALLPAERRSIRILNGLGRMRECTFCKRTFCDGSVGEAEANRKFCSNECKRGAGTNKKSIKKAEAELDLAETILMELNQRPE